MIENLILNLEQALLKVDWINPLAVIISGIISALVSWVIAQITMKQQNKLVFTQLTEQKRQWQYGPYIQEEAEIILEFRNLLYQAEEAMFWFSDILKPYKVMMKMFPEQDVSLKDTSLIVKFEDYCKHFDTINELNCFYNKNQMILKKNGIEEEFIYITAILSTISWFNNTNDFYYDLITNNDTCMKYKLNVINQIGQLFVHSIDVQKNPENIVLNYSEEKLQEYSNEIMSIHFKLTRKLDELTTYYEGDLPNNLKMFKFHKYPFSKDYIKIINKNRMKNNDL